MKLEIRLTLDIKVDEKRFNKENISRITERFVDYLINNSTYIEIGLPERNIVLDPVHAECSGIIVRRMF